MLKNKPGNKERIGEETSVEKQRMRIKYFQYYYTFILKYLKDHEKHKKFTYKLHKSRKSLNKNSVCVCVMV